MSAQVLLGSAPAAPLLAQAAGLTAVRILGAVVAVAVLVGVWTRYRRRETSRLSVIISGLLSAGMLLLAVAPRLFNPLFETFNFEQGNQQQLIAAVIFGVFILFALTLRNMANTDATLKGLRRLIESITIQAFDSSKAEDLPPGDKVFVVIPAYNEEENVGAVLAAMPREIHGLPVVALVVDDASEDATSQAARKEGALVLRLPIRRGQGMALRVGYELATKLGATLIASLDADGQHVPDELALVVEPLIRGHADMVVGSRVLGVYERESRLRHIGVFVLSGLVSLLYGSRVTDVSSGFRATRADVMRRLVLEQDQYSSEVLVEALRHKARVREVPITVRARASGTSKKPGSLKYGYRFSKVILQTWLR